MGLDLIAVTKKLNKERDSVQIGYIGFMEFRQDLMSFVSHGHFENLLTGLYDDGRKIALAYQNDKTGIICESEKDFTKKELNDPNVQKYLRRLKHMKLYYPKLRKIYGFLVHSDCEGELSRTQCINLLKIVKEFYSYSKRNYGYKNIGYNFTQRFIRVLEKSIKMYGGKIIYR